MRNRAAAPHDVLFVGRVVIAPFAASQAPGVPHGFRLAELARLNSLPAKSPARLLGPCEDGSGCDDDEGASAPAPRTSGTGRCAAGACLLFAGPLVAAPF